MTPDEARIVAETEARIVVMRERTTYEPDDLQRFCRHCGRTALAVPVGQNQSTVT